MGVQTTKASTRGGWGVQGRGVVEEQKENGVMAIYSHIKRMVLWCLRKVGMRSVFKECHWLDTGSHRIALS